MHDMTSHSTRLSQASAAFSSMYLLTHTRRWKRRKNNFCRPVMRTLFGNTDLDVSNVWRQRSIRLVDDLCDSISRSISEIRDASFLRSFHNTTYRYQGQPDHNLANRYVDSESIFRPWFRRKITHIHLNGSSASHAIRNGSLMDSRCLPYFRICDVQPFGIFNLTLNILLLCHRIRWAKSAAKRHGSCGSWLIRT